MLALALGSMLVMWSGNYVAGKFALRHIDALSLASLRIELAAMLMLVLYFLRERPRLRRGDLWTFFGLGFFGVAINQGCFTVGLGYTSSSHAVILVALDPMIVLLLASAMKLEKFTPGKLVGIAIAFAGVLLLETERNSGQASFWLGDLLTLGCVLGFAVYSVLGKRAAIKGIGKGYDAVAVNTFMTGFAGLLLAPLAIHQAVTIDWKSVGWVGWSGLVYMAVFSSVVSYTMFAWILKYMDASRIATVMYLQVPIVIVLAVWTLGERPSAHLLSGAVLVLAGIFVAERRAGFVSAAGG
jgi:drug/metabolite transporter (DMT)-like permease